MIKLHITIFKFLKEELKKKRTPKELVVFLKTITIQYFTVLGKEYKRLFNFLDKDYRIQQKQLNRQEQVVRDLQNGLKLLKYLNTKWIKKYNSQQNKQRWLDFTKSHHIRTDELVELEKELELYRKQI
jgi:hypothetical protein